MIAVDTNILLRYFDQDGEQGLLATRLIEDQLTAQNRGFISLIVICEMVWVMQRAYRADRASIGAFLRGLVSAPQFEVQEQEAVVKAIEREKQDIADALIHAVGRIAGCSSTLTFDRVFARLDGVQLLA